MIWTAIAGSLVAIVLLGWLFLIGTPFQRIGIAVAALAALGAAVATWDLPLPERQAQVPTDEPPVQSNKNPLLPRVNTEAGYVSAAACQECHPDQFESWHATYHRTMTQRATPEAVVPSFDNVTLRSRGRTYHLKRRGDEFWVDTVDPAAEMRAAIQGVDLTELAAAGDVPRAERQIVMTTGSHYHQTYWMQNPNGTLIQFPWVYHINTGRWVFRIDSFLRPPSDRVTYNIWNMHCLGCHSTGGEPRVDPRSKSMHSVGELGISCEACHGPGAEHVQLARHASVESVREAPGIVNPSEFSAEESAKICGQCHVTSEHRNEREFLAHGDPYRPGRSGFETLRKVIRRSEDILVEDGNHGRSLKSRFWPDGTIRTGGREYNGLIRSRCYTDGEGSQQMSCLSCHSMHEYNSPSKLIARGMDTNLACTQCHAEPQYTEHLVDHTHHAVESVGSRCVNCHMPHTSYAIFAAIRSHRIQSPSVRSGRGARPNACNLCHLDQTQSWAGARLAEWYGAEPLHLEGDEASIAAGTLWALKGDAAQRAITAWHMRWEPARKTAGPQWMPAVLAELLTDSYSGVRYVAYESLKTHSGFGDLEYDFDGPEDARRSVQSEVLEQWRDTHPQFADVTRADRLLLGPDGTRRVQTMQRLLKQQDPRPIHILE